MMKCSTAATDRTLHSPFCILHSAQSHRDDMMARPLFGCPVIRTPSNRSMTRPCVFKPGYGLPVYRTTRPPRPIFLFFTGAPLLPTIFFARRSPILTIHHQLGTIDCPHRPPPYTSFSACCIIRWIPIRNPAAYATSSSAEAL